LEAEAVAGPVVLMPVSAAGLGQAWLSLGFFILKNGQNVFV
jgi:hypothetical protein